MGGRKDYVLIGKKWLSALLELHYKQSNGQVLAEIRSRIKNADRISKLELLGGGEKPDGIWEWLLGKNDVLMEACQGLVGGALINAFRSSDVFKNYRFREEIMRRATAIDFVTHTESVRRDQDFRAESPGVSKVD